MEPTPLTPIAALLEKAADLQPIQKRFPLIQKFGQEFYRQISPQIARKPEDADPVDFSSRAMPTLRMNETEVVSPEMIAEQIRRYGILKSLGYLSYKSESSISLSAPVPPARSVRGWERACLLLPSFSSASEDDYI